MPSAWIVEAIDVLEDRHLGLPPGCPRPSPDQLGLDGFEERFNGRIDAPMFVKRQESGSVRCRELGIFRGRCIV